MVSSITSVQKKAPRQICVGVHYKCVLMTIDTSGTLLDTWRYIDAIGKERLSKTFQLVFLLPGSTVLANRQNKIEIKPRIVLCQKPRKNIELLIPVL